MVASSRNTLNRTDIEFVAGDELRVERVSVTEPQGARCHHYHDYYELYYLYSGDRYYFIKDNTYRVKSGSLVLIKPYDMHSTGKVASSGYDRCLVYFHKSFVKDFLEGAGCASLLSCFVGGGSIMTFEAEEREGIERLLGMMLEEFEKKRSGYLQFIKASLIQLLLLIARYTDSGVVKTGNFDYFNSTHKTVSEVAAYINNNYSEDITLASISEKFFISPCYFSRIFKKVTGFSFIEYLNGVRVKEAQRLLAKTDKSIADIGEEVGYKSNTHFGRAFKASVGTSPAAYRRRVAKQNKIDAKRKPGFV